MPAISLTVAVTCAIPGTFPVIQQRSPKPLAPGPAPASRHGRILFPKATAMTLRRFLFGSYILLALIACGLGSRLIFGQAERLAAISDTAARLEALRALAEVPRYLSPERGFTALVLQTARGRRRHDAAEAGPDAGANRCGDGDGAGQGCGTGVPAGQWSCDRDADVRGRAAVRQRARLRRRKRCSNRPISVAMPWTRFSVRSPRSTT
jgi:hypothetical protein